MNIMKRFGMDLQLHLSNVGMQLQETTMLKSLIQVPLSLSLPEVPQVIGSP